MNDPRPVSVLVSPEVVSPREALPVDCTEPMFQMVKRADLSPAEVEDIATRALEVTVLWQGSVLQVSHLGEGEDFVLSSDAADLRVAGRFVVDATRLGATRVVLVRRDPEGARFVFPAGMDGAVELDGQHRSLDDLIRQGIARPAAEGGLEVTLLPEGRYTVDVAGLTIAARLVAAGRKPLMARRRDPILARVGAGVSLVVAALVAATRLAAGDDGLVSADDHTMRMEDLRRFAMAQSHRPESAPETPHEGAAEAPAGAAHAGAAGAMGPRTLPPTGRRYEMPRRATPPSLVRPQTAREQVAQRGVFAALGAPGARAAQQEGVQSMFGQMVASGEGERTALGNLNGAEPGESGGFGGLDTLSTGWGGGGDAEGAVGTGHLATVGHAGCEGPQCRHGSSAGGPLRDRRPSGPRATPQPPVVLGSISPEIIRRVVRRNLAQVNHCYEQGLAMQPGLTGRVAVRFVIGSSGSVMGAQVAQDDLGAPAVGQCIARAVQRWSFDIPADTSAITVTYPFTLMPADG